MAFVVYGGEETYRLKPGIDAIGVTSLQAALQARDGNKESEKRRSMAPTKGGHEVHRRAPAPFTIDDPVHRLMFLTVSPV